MEQLPFGGRQFAGTGTVLCVMCMLVQSMHVSCGMGMMGSAVHVVFHVRQYCSVFTVIPGMMPFAKTVNSMDGKLE